MSLKNIILSVGFSLLSCVMAQRAVAFETASLTDGQAENVVRSLYRDYLNRAEEASDAEIYAWIGDLRSLGSKGLAQRLLVSDEKRQGLIVQAYSQFLDRSPEPAALTQYLNNLRAGTSIEDIKVVLITSAEYRNRSGGSGIGFIIMLYEDIIGGSPSQGEVDAWQPILRNEGKVEVAHRFLNSLEYRNHTIADFYRKYLLREAGDDEIRDWTDLLSAGQTMDDVETSIIGSDEYLLRNIN